MPKRAARPARRRGVAATSRTSAAEAVTAARDLARAGQHAQAIDLVSSALANAKSDADDALALLDCVRRASSRSATWSAPSPTPKQCERTESEAVAPTFWPAR